MENWDLNKLDMDVEDAKKISVKYALCDFQYETGCLKLKKKITKTKILSYSQQLHVHAIHTKTLDISHILQWSFNTSRFHSIFKFEQKCIKLQHMLDVVCESL